MSIVEVLHCCVLHLFKFNWCFLDNLEGCLVEGFRTVFSNCFGQFSCITTQPVPIYCRVMPSPLVNHSSIVCPSIRPRSSLPMSRENHIGLSPLGAIGFLP